MQKLADEYENSLNGLEFSQPCIKFISSVTATEKATDFGPSYWVQNLVSKVRFSDALISLCGIQQRTPNTYTMVEIGPHNALSSPIRETLTLTKPDHSRCTYLPSLVRNTDALHSTLRLAGKLFELGHMIDLQAVNTIDRDTSQSCVVMRNLPPYPWDHSTSYWHETRMSKLHRLRKYPYHDLLGLMNIGSSIHNPIWNITVGIDTHPWLRDHVIDNFMIYPGAGYICMALEGLRQIIQERQITGVVHQYKLRDVRFLKALVISDPPCKVELQLSMWPPRFEDGKHAAGLEDFLISSIAADGTWNKNCQGSIICEFDILDDSHGALEDDPKEINIKQQQVAQGVCTRKISGPDMYAELCSNGIIYGKCFATTKELDIGSSRALGVVVTPNILNCMPGRFMQPHLIHPTLLDALFHATVMLYLQQCASGPVMPVSIKEITITASNTALNMVDKELLASTHFYPVDSRAGIANIMAFPTGDNPQTIPAIAVSGLELCGIGDVSTRRSSSSPYTGFNITYQLVWDTDVDVLTSEILGFSKPAIPLPEMKMPPANFEEASCAAVSLYIKQCLAQIDDQIAEISAPHLVHYYHWAKKYAASQGSQRLIAGLSGLQAAQNLAELHRLGVEGEIICKIGNDLPSILSGTTDPLALLLEDGLLYRQYAESPFSCQCNSFLVTFIELLAFKYPRLNVLEIGAGTGGTTLPLFKALGDRARLLFQCYDSADISSGFFESAKSSFRPWLHLIRYQTLNVEQDPVSQGFRSGSYDLIIASNVVHATADIGSSLANIR